jgi:putative phage-type endonuclease
MNREEWLAGRHTGIGASEAAAVLGLSRYKSPLEVYLEKIGELGPQDDSERMYWGRKLEAIIAQEYGIRTGLKVNLNEDYTVLVHPDHKWMRCTLDAIAHDPEKGPGNVQCKNVDRFSAHEWADGVPEEYLIQVMHEMAVAGFNWGCLAVLIGGNQFKAYEFDRDNELIDLIIEKEEKFWKENVMQQIPPSATGASIEALSKLYPKDNGQLVAITNGIGKDIVNYTIVKERLKEIENQEAELKARIQGVMGEAQKGIYQHDDGSMYVVSWSTVAGRTSFDAKAFEKDHPELYAQYCRTGSSYRRFMVTQKKGKLTAQEQALIGG